MTRRTTILLAAVTSGLVGVGAGYLVGRSSVPASAFPASAATEERAAAATAGQEIVPGAPVQNLDPKNLGNRKPVTSASLRADLASMETGGFYSKNAMRKYAEFQERLKVSDVPALAAEMCSGPSPDELGTGQALVLAAYAESDPKGAWNFALGIKQAGMRSEVVAVVISSIAANDPVGAMALVDSLTEPQLKSRGRFIAISIMAEKDPEAAKAAVARLSGKEAEAARRDLVWAIAKWDPQAAWAYAASLPASSPDDPYGGQRVMAIRQWAQTDPQAALKASLTIDDNGERSKAIAAAVGAWAATDFSAALIYAISVQDPETRGNILERLSQSPNADSKALFEAVLEHVPSGPSFHTSVSSVLSNWATKNPAAAAAAAMQLPAGPTFSRVASQIASEWMGSATNKQEVLAWVQSLPAGEARANGMSSVFGRWSRDDPQAAARALSDLTSEDRKRALPSIAYEWAKTSPDTALKWSASLADPAEHANAVQIIFSQWAEASPEAAVRHATSLPESERAASLEGVVGTWGSRDPVSAAAWLDKQPGGPSKDGGLRAMSDALAEENPEAALIWAAEISDEKQRFEQTERIASNWVRYDRNAAQAWISKSNLPEETRKKLLK